MKIERKISRRNFIQKTVELGAGTLSIPFLPSILHTASLLPISTISIAAGNVSEAQLVEKAIEQIGGMKKYVKRGDVVVIKPNLVYKMPYKFAVTTNPFVIEKVVQMCLDAGAKKVKIAENPSDSNDAAQIFKLTGIEKVCRQTGAELVYPHPNRFREMAIGGKTLKKHSVFIDCVQCDKLINIPIVKDHIFSSLSCAMKNFLGAVGGNRFDLHLDLHQNIVDLSRFFKPALIVVDAVRVLKRNGPAGGSLRDVENKYTVMAGTDIVACDSYAAKLLNLSPASIDFIKLAAEQKLGNSDFGRIKEIKAAF
jgi:uncharacterized protein (DUF362 family)